MAKYRLFNADCLLTMPKLEENSFDSIVTDPPYGLKFMGKSWDHGVPGVPFWEQALRVAKPGAFLLAFGGTRTFHRLAVAIEDAGWEIRETLMWIYGSGFPKSHDIGKAIDKEAGAVREVVGTKHGLPGYSLTDGKPGGVAMSGNIDGSLRNGQAECDITAPTTDEAKQWQGWGTALKPAYEPIIVARKPFTGTVAQNVLEYGTGGLNIDASRVGTADNLNGGRYSDNKQGDDGNTYGTGLNLRSANDYSQPTGRFPANLIHDGSEEVVSLFPNQSGKVGMTQHGSGTNTKYGKFARSDKSFTKDGVKDNGSAARFFYTPKANKKERGEGNNHPTVKPLALIEYLVRLVTQPEGIVLDPFMGSGTTGIACGNLSMRFVGVEMDKEHGYFKIARNRIREAYNG